MSVDRETWELIKMRVVLQDLVDERRREQRILLLEESERRSTDAIKHALYILEKQQLEKDIENKMKGHT
jgi:hypothetical protein